MMLNKVMNFYSLPGYYKYSVMLHNMEQLRSIGPNFRDLMDLQVLQDLAQIFCKEPKCALTDLRVDWPPTTAQDASICSIYDTVTSLFRVARLNYADGKKIIRKLEALVWDKMTMVLLVISHLHIWDVRAVPSCCSMQHALQRRVQAVIRPHSVLPQHTVPALGHVFRRQTAF